MDTCSTLREYRDLGVRSPESNRYKIFEKSQLNFCARPADKGLMNKDIRNALVVFRDEAIDALRDIENSLIEMNLDRDIDKNCVNVSRFLYGIHDGAKSFALNDLSEHMNYMFFLINQITANKEFLDLGVHHLIDACEAARVFFRGGELKINRVKAISDVPKKLSEQTVLNYQMAFNLYKSQKQSKGLVMIVDDEPDIVELLECTLQDSEFAVEKFTNAKALLARLEVKTPDLIVCDYNMPELNGLELLEQVRSKNGTTPVVFLSAYLSKDVCLKALKLGAYGFLEKPMNEIQLILMLDTAIARSRAARLINRSNNFLSYHLSELYDFLLHHGKKDLANSIRLEIEEIQKQKEKIDELHLADVSTRDFSKKKAS